jgi:phosphoribosylamine--glycine ligase
VDDALSDRIMRTIVDPVLAGMKSEGTPFAGVLYCGLMLTADGPKVIEFNVRFGDPEAQVVLPLLPVDLAPLLRAAAAGHVPVEPLPRPSGARVGVVLASGGYPGAMTTGHPIAGADAAEAHEGVVVFHAGTTTKDGEVVTAGGRVLTVVGEGPDLKTARDRAYAAVTCISFEDMHFRKDIAGAYG